MIDIFDIQVFFSLCTIVFVDYLSMFVTKWYNSRLRITPNTRWFFIHAFVNLVVTTTTFSDVIECFSDPYSCKSRISSSSQIGYNMAVVSHLYHMVFFYNFLTYYEWLHHIIMCFICGPLANIYNHDKICMSSLWFLSGFPGLIDYTMLYLVKLDKVTSRFQKQLYLYISTMIRSPGCIIMAYIQFINLHKVRNIDEFVARILLSSLVLWNAQYFLYITIRDTTNKLHL